MALMVKNLPATGETWVQFLDQENPLEKGMATHSSILAWRILWIEEPVGYSPRGHKESDTTERLHLPFPDPGNLPNPGIEPKSPGIAGDSLPSEPSGKPIFVYC